MITNNLYLDVSRKEIKSITVSQGDKDSRTWNVYFSNNGTQLDLSSISSISVQMRKPDNTFIYNPCQINLENNCAILTFDEQMTASDGVGSLQMSLYTYYEDTGNLEKLYTFAIKVIISSNFVPIDSITSSSEFKKLDELMAKAENTYEEIVNSVKDSEDNAKESEDNAKVSEDNARISEVNAKASEDASKLSETNAKESELNAKESETNALECATNAATSEANALESANKAAQSEENIKAIELTSSTYAESAKTSADNALASEQNAKQSEENASESETKALESANNAENSATNALLSETKALEYSNNAKTSETNSSISESNAKASEEASKLSETNAKSSEDNASQYATNALNSANNAKLSEDNAKLYEESAKEAKEASATSATNATTSEQNAATSESNAKVSEENASNSATQSENYSKLSKSYAVGDTGVRENEDTDNSKYYYEQCIGVRDSLGGSYKPKGKIRFSEIPLTPNPGDMYQITNDFTTDERFKTSGVNYQAGTIVYYTVDGKWEIYISGEGGGTSIDDTISSNTTTYSSNKIDDLLSNKLDSTGDASEVTVNFEEATERAKPTTGEKLKLMMGKLAKLFTDLKTIAFSGSYNDLSDTPTVPTLTNSLTATVAGTALDATQGKALNDKITTINSDLAKNTEDISTLNSNLLKINGKSQCFRSYFIDNPVSTVTIDICNFNYTGCMIIVCVGANWTRQTIKIFLCTTWYGSSNFKEIASSNKSTAYDITLSTTETTLTIDAGDSTFGYYTVSII